MAIGVYAVPPDLTALRVTTEDSTELVEIHPVGGAGYAVFEVAPEGARYTVELLIGDQVVPGSRVDRTVPER